MNHNLTCEEAEALLGGLIFCSYVMGKKPICVGTWVRKHIAFWHWLDRGFVGRQPL